MPFVQERWSTKPQSRMRRMQILVSQGMPRTPLIKKGKIPVPTMQKRRETPQTMRGDMEKSEITWDTLGDERRHQQKNPTSGNVLPTNDQKLDETKPSH